MTRQANKVSLKPSMKRTNNSETKLRKNLRRLTKQQIEKFATNLDEEQLEKLYFDWYLWARDDQLPPNLQPPTSEKYAKEWQNWILLGGRGAGKTRAGAEWVRAMALGIEPFAKSPAWRIALVGETFNDVREVMLEGDSGLLNIHPRHQKPTYIASRKRLEWPNGAIAQLFSAEEPESLRGPQFHAAWCDEFAKWQYDEDVWDMLQFGMRLGEHPQIVITTTPRNRKKLKDILAMPNSYVSRASTFANKQNLAGTFLRTIDANYAGTNLGRQELYGELIEDNEGALWTYELIEDLRRNRKNYDFDDFERIILAIDPPATSHKKSNACGMIVAAIDDNRHAYILADVTMQAVSPIVWAQKAVQVYHEFNVDRIVAEVNQGGEMVETILRTIDPQISYAGVFAKKNKKSRAEPVAALYEQGKVHHLGMFEQLEDEMCQFDHFIMSSKNSPDRVDALVWAVSHLLLNGGVSVPRIRDL